MRVEKREGVGRGGGEKEKKGRGKRMENRGKETEKREGRRWRIKESRGCKRERKRDGETRENR